jgi:hypothetical protein
MDLDDLVGASAPETDGPTAEVVQRHREALTERLERASGHRARPSRSRRRHRRTPPGPLGPRAAAAAAAAAVLVVAGAVIARGTTGGQVVAAGGGATTPSVAPATTTNADPTGGSSPDSGASIDPEDLPSAAGTGTGIDEWLCGATLPEGVQILPGEVDAIELRPAQLEGQLAERRTRGPVTVEYRWPAAPRAQYATDEVAPLWPESNMVSDEGGVYQLWLGRDPAVPVEREPVEGPPFEHGGEPIMGALDDGGTEIWVIDRLSEEVLRQLGGPRTGLDDRCALIAIEVYQADVLIDRFGWDMRSDLRSGWPVVTIDPLIREVRQVADPPTEATRCDEPSVPNKGGTEQGPSFPTPAEALLNDLSDPDHPTPASGWVEMIAADGRRVYGMAFDGGDRFTILITVAPDGDGGWTVTEWTSSGC